MGFDNGGWFVIRRGQIFRVAFDPALGSEVQKTRPAIVVSNDKNNQYSHVVTILLITSKRKDRLYPFEVQLFDGDGGLRQGGTIKADQIRSVGKQRLRGHALGTLDRNLMNAVNEAIKIHLALS
jgi:mRNA interferase MazF